jgi:hypothetical protein
MRREEKKKRGKEKKRREMKGVKRKERNLLLNLDVKIPCIRNLVIFWQYCNCY